MNQHWAAVRTDGELECPDIDAGRAQRHGVVFAD
jgi:hypothetical protein